MNFTHASLFSGIVGFDLAAEWMGWQNLFHCEWNEFCQKVLAYHFPNSIPHHDITKTDFTIYRGRVDILTGGFPCQPYSVAGEQKGTDDSRHLWPHMLRAIGEIQPDWVVGENVLGLVSWNGGMVFDQIQTDLENAGYEVWPYVLPAVSVGAPHKRERVWFVAHATKGRRGTVRPCPGPDGYENNESIGTDVFCKTERLRSIWVVTNANGNGYGSDYEFGQIGSTQSEGKSVKDKRKRIRCKPWGTSTTQATSHTYKLNGYLSRFRASQISQYQEAEVFDDINAYASSPRRQEQYVPGFAAKPGIGNRRGNEAGTNSGFNNFPTQSPVCNGDDGLSAKLDGITFPKWRNESIKGGGNAIVPQVALQIFKAIEKYTIFDTSMV